MSFRNPNYDLTIELQENTQRDFLELSICSCAFLSQFWVCLDLGTAQNSFWKWWLAVFLWVSRMQSCCSSWRFSQPIKSCRIAAQCVIRIMLDLFFIVFPLYSCWQQSHSRRCFTQHRSVCAYWALTEGVAGCSSLFFESTHEWAVVSVEVVQCSSFCLFCWSSI